MRLGANRRDKNGNIRRHGVAAARYPCDVNGFIISRRQRRANGEDRHRMYLARDGAKSQEEIGKLLEGDGRGDTDCSFNPVATLDIVALNSSSPLYPNRLSVFDLCDEA